MSRGFNSHASPGMYIYMYIHRYTFIQHIYIVRIHMHTHGI